METLIYVLIGMVVCVTILMVGLVKQQLWKHKNSDVPSYWQKYEPDMFNWSMMGLVCGGMWPLAMFMGIGYGLMLGLIKALEVVAKRIAKGIITVNKVAELD